METKKVYIDRDGKGVLICPHCGTSKTVDARRFRRLREALKVRCTCRSEFSVCLEFRGTHRKKTNLKGHYTKLPVSWGDMVVKNLSLTGLGFETLVDPKLKEGDEVSIKFVLDDPGRSEIKKKVLVRTVEGRYIGCEFAESVVYDKALGFYLLS